MRETSFSPDHRAEVNSDRGSKRHMIKSKTQSFWRGSRLLSLICALSLSVIFVNPAAAKSLDEQLNFLLKDSCDVLNHLEIGITYESGGLSNLCVDGSGFGGGTSTGGAAGVPQVAPTIVLDRLQEARGEETDADTDESGMVSKISPKLSLIFSVEGEALDRDVTRFEAGYDSDILRLTAGIDSQFTDKFLAGLAFTYNDHNGDLSSDGGDFENDSFGLLVYSSFIPTQGVFIQATGGYASKGFKRTRIASFKTDVSARNIEPGPVKSNYDGNEYSAGVMVGYDRSINNITFGPRASLDWVYNEFDGYSEKGDTGLELTFEDTSESSLQSRLGMAGSMAISTGFGVLVPQLYANWVHEFENGQRTENFRFNDVEENIPFQYEDEPPDQDFIELAAGVSVVLPNGWQTYVQYRTILGHNYIDSHVGAIGMRAEF
jgi:outer membrane autotransporter protein